MKKRIISFLLVLCLMGTMLSACKQGATANAQDLIARASAKTATLQDLDVTFDLQIDVTTQGVTVSVPANINIKVKDVTTSNPLIYASLNASAMGQTINAELYWDGSWTYMNYNGTGFKISTENFDWEDALNSGSGSNTNADQAANAFSEDLLKNATVTNNADGSQSVSVKILGSAFQDLYNTLMDTVGDAAALSAYNITFKDTTLNITIKDDYIVGYAITTAMDMSASGQSVGLSMNFDLKLNNPGQAVTITPPTGYQSYQELDPESLGGFGF